jgi:CHASE3 domain sensor protein
MIKKLSFGKRIYLGFGSITFLIVIIALVASNRLRQMKEHDNLYRQLLSIEKIILNMRNNEKSFLLYESVNRDFFNSGKSSYVDNFTQEHNELIQLLNDVQDNKLLPQDTTTSINTIKEYVDNYYNAFQEIVEKNKSREYKDLGLQGSFSNDAQKFESEIKQKKNPNIELNYLTLSKHVKDFLIYKDTIYVTAFNALAQHLLLNIPGDLKQSATKYIEGFNN